MLHFPFFSLLFFLYPWQLWITWKLLVSLRLYSIKFFLETEQVANTYQVLISLLSIYLLDASLDGMEILVTFALPYQDVFTEAVEIIPIPVFVKKAGKAICVMNQFVCKLYFLTLKTYILSLWALVYF